MGRVVTDYELAALENTLMMLCTAVSGSTGEKGRRWFACERIGMRQHYKTSHLCVNCTSPVPVDSGGVAPSLHSVISELIAQHVEQVSKLWQTKCFPSNSLSMS